MSNKKYIEQVANMLGVELLEEFKIRPTKIGKTFKKVSALCCGKV